MDAQTVEVALRPFFRDPSLAPDIAAAWLFGSTARGTQRTGSDIDIGVLYSGEPPPGLARFHLEGEVERLLRHPVQLVVLNRAPVDLIHRVLRDGLLLAERDRSRRIAFEVRTRNEYFDLLPILREVRRPREPLL
jgi:uncharacterized protein